MATNPLSTMRFHRSLGIFVIIFTRFSLISQSILNRFSCNFAGNTCNYSCDCPEKFVKFGRVFLKLLRWSKTIVGQVDLTAKLCLSFCLELQSAKSTYQHVDLDLQWWATQQLEFDSRSSEIITVYFYLQKWFTEAKLGSTRHQVDLAHCYTRNTEYTELVPPRSTIN